VYQGEPYLVQQIFLPLEFLYAILYENATVTSGLWAL